MTRIPLLLGITAAAALALAGCAGPAPEPEPARDTISVVASTNVYGDIAATIGGDAVTVTSIIDSAAADPHSYEASARDQLAISEADLIILNGGGYDPFMETLIEASGTQAVVINAVEVVGLVEDDHDHAEDETHNDDSADAEDTADDHDHGDDDSHDDHDHAEEQPDADDHDHAGHHHIEGVNEHVWYDLHAMGELAHEIAHALGELAPADAPTIEANAEEFEAGIEQLEARADELKAAHEGDGIALTEPVPAYLLEAAGFVNLTPDAFSEAIEEGADVPPAALQQTLDLVTSGKVVLLAYNEQTASPETERVRTAAESANVPVVDFTETLPEGQTYLSWMSANLDAIAAAVA